MGLPISVLLGLLVVMHSAELLAPLPLKVQKHVRNSINVYYAQMDSSMPEGFKGLAEGATAVSEFTGPASVAPTEVKHTNKPLVTFERYLAHQRKLKKQKRNVASVTMITKNKSAKHTTPFRKKDVVRF